MSKSLHLSEPWFPQVENRLHTNYCLTGLLPKLTETMCVKQLRAWHRVIWLNTMTSHFTDLETEAWEAPGPRPQIKSTVDPGGEERRSGLGAHWKVGTSKKPSPHPLFSVLIKRHEAPSMVLDTEDVGFLGGPEVLCLWCAAAAGQTQEGSCSPAYSPSPNFISRLGNSQHCPHTPILTRTRMHRLTGCRYVQAVSSQPSGPQAPSVGWEANSFKSL